MTEEHDWVKLPSESDVSRAVESLKSHGINVFVVKDKEEALNRLKRAIPKGASVANGSSTTLNEIGFTDYLKSGNHGWKNLHEDVLNEKDPVRQGDLRRKMTTADYFLGSVNAISKTGELVACDQSGSRTGAYLFAAKNLILVSGINKITGNLSQAMQRVREHVFPLEDARAKKAYGRGSAIAKWAIIEQEKTPNRITLILVKEKLGF
jgi:LUD domain